jgi:hypothetical protein
VDGRANVHCDPLQFLSEFGMIGVLCMALAVAVLVSSAVSARRGVLFIWVVSGIVAVFVHSLIDLPFRCSAILLEWCFLFSALPLLMQRHFSTES